ncbi:50S ribosomal protein L29 [Patescibacteria group bacterium]|nr:50S ribosomal protein L29 [Patescibacteria group bacterium]MBU1931286.1 50S ribosomal protein L29 [Patescibacteria group bacterium]
MKSKELKELHQQTLIQLQQSLKQAQAELFKARIAKATKKIKDNQVAKRIRKKIKIIKTIIREKELVK